MTHRHAFLRAMSHTGPEGTTRWLDRAAQSFGKFARRAVNTNWLLTDGNGLSLRRRLNLNVALLAEIAAGKIVEISAPMDLSRPT